MEPFYICNHLFFHFLKLSTIYFCFTVKLQKSFVDYETSSDFPSARGWVDNDHFWVNVSINSAKTCPIKEGKYYKLSSTPEEAPKTLFIDNSKQNAQQTHNPYYDIYWYQIWKKTNIIITFFASPENGQTDRQTDRQTDNRRHMAKFQ